MAPSNEDTRNLLGYIRGRSMSISEACNYMQMIDSMPGGCSSNMRWVNSRTGAPVCIGYTGGTGYSKGPKKKRKSSIHFCK